MWFIRAPAARISPQRERRGRLGKSLQQMGRYVSDQLVHIVPLCKAPDPVNPTELVMVAAGHDGLEPKGVDLLQNAVVGAAAGRPILLVHLDDEIRSEVLRVGRSIPVPARPLLELGAHRVCTLANILTHVARHSCMREELTHPREVAEVDELGVAIDEIRDFLSALAHTSSPPGPRSRMRTGLQRIEGASWMAHRSGCAQLLEICAKVTEDVLKASDWSGHTSGLRLRSCRGMDHNPGMPVGLHRLRAMGGIMHENIEVGFQT